MTVPSDRGPRQADWWLVGLLSLLVFVVAHRHGLLNPWIINDDARQQLFWMARWLDPALYPADLLVTYAAAYVPVGVKAVYFTAATVFGLDPLLTSKLVTGALFCLFALAVFGIGCRLEGRVLGFFAAGLSWLLPYFLSNMSGGLSRAFASPLLALFVLCWMRGSGAGMAVVLLLEAVCIPYIALLCAGCACLDAFLARLADRRTLAPFSSRPWHGLVLLGAGFLVWSMNHKIDALGFGPLVDRARLAAGPEFSAAGRLDLYPLPNPFFDLVYWPFESIGLFLDAGLVAGIVSLVCLAPLVVLGVRRAPWRELAAHLRPAAMLLAGSLTLYVLARAVALRLFVPDRYITYSWHLLLLLFLAVVLRHAFAGLLRRRRAGTVLCLLAAGFGAWRLTDVGLYDYSADAPLYAAVRTTDKDALFAGNPKLLDNVLTFGRRDVLASFELAHPWCEGYWSRLYPRLAHQADAYYAKDPAVVLEFAKAYGITHFVVRESDFTPSALAGHPLFAPFDGQIRALAARPGGFALLDATRFPYTSPEPGLRIVDMRPLLAHRTASP